MTHGEIKEINTNNKRVIKIADKNNDAIAIVYGTEWKKRLFWKKKWCLNILLVNPTRGTSEKKSAPRFFVAFY